MVKMKKTYKKKIIFSFLLVAVLMMCGCGNVNSDLGEASDSSDASGSEEVSESEKVEEDNTQSDAICWIMETEKEKALTARGETYELILADAGDNTDNEGTNSDNTTDDASDSTGDNNGSSSNSTTNTGTTSDSSAPSGSNSDSTVSNSGSTGSSSS